MMRRLPHGATTRPPLSRPGSGYGRPVREGPPGPLLEHAAKAPATTRDYAVLLSVSLDDD